MPDMSNMPNMPLDTSIHQGLHLYDGTDYDTVVERVEYGGFGVIAFGANRLRNGQMTVYKTLRRDLLEDERTQSAFVRECLLWIGLWDHPNIATAYAVLAMGDAINQRTFLALAYAERGSLRELLRRTSQQPGGRLSLADGLWLAQQIAAGLAYLHQPDRAYLRPDPTVHRDLKPENVLLMDDGRAVITDFGLAKAVEESPNALILLLSQSAAIPARLAEAQGRQAEEAILVDGEAATQTAGVHTINGIALGTIPYMPPEQWEDARHAGTPADVYALGVMLSEILTGRHALLDLYPPQTRARWREAHRNPHPRPLRDVVPDVPQVVEEIYRRCLSANPQDRPTADEVFAALQAGARAAQVEVYTPAEMAKHTPYNEFVHWHQWANACYRFGLYNDALARNNRALELARQLRTERPDALPIVLLTRGAIMKGLGSRAQAAGRDAEVAAWDRQAEAAYEESLSLRSMDTAEGRMGRAFVWHSIGVLNKERKRYAYAEDAYARALKLQPDMADTYKNRSLNQAEWGMTEAEAGHREAAIAHLRQARVFAATSHLLGDPTAQRLLKLIEEALANLGVSSQ